MKPAHRTEFLTVPFHRLPLGEDLGHFCGEILPLRFSPEIVRHEKASAQKIGAQCTRFLR